MASCNYWMKLAATTWRWQDQHSSRSTFELFFVYLLQVSLYLLWANCYSHGTKRNPCYCSFVLDSFSIVYFCIHAYTMKVDAMWLSTWLCYAKILVKFHMGIHAFPWDFLTCMPFMNRELLWCYDSLYVSAIGCNRMVLFRTGWFLCWRNISLCPCSCSYSLLSLFFSLIYRKHADTFCLLLFNLM
jgi:hypothetical protein